jgi:glutamate/tyrosine decarboxylase-like PLP-dependent enzyme
MNEEHFDLNAAIDALRQLVAGHLEHERAHPVRVPVAADELRERLDLELRDYGMPVDALLGSVREVLEHTPSTSSPRFFNQLFAGRDNFAVLGDALAAVLNNSMYTYKVGGPQVLIELTLLRHMGRLMGYPNADGVFTPGGSLSNLCAMLMARDAACPWMREEGADARRLRVYTSEESHYSLRKAAGVSGIGRGNVVEIPADSRGRMRTRELDAALRADRAAGHIPVMINATAGTTVLGAIDPLEEIGVVAREHGVWFHIDGAFGGSLAFHPEFEDQMRGAADSDSVAWDPHKLMGVPLICSVILVKKRGLLEHSLNEAASYLYQGDDDELNPGVRSLQCGRRNDALKLWMSWKAQGDAGFRGRVESLRKLTLSARDRVVASPRMELVREPESMNLCFSVHGVEADHLCTELHRSGEAMVGYAMVDDRPVVRLAFANPDISEQDLDDLFAAILSTADALSPKTVR